MSLNNIRLNNHLLVHLYEHTLLEMAENLPAASTYKDGQKLPPNNQPAGEKHGQVGNLTLKATAATPLSNFKDKEFINEIAAAATEYGNTPSLGENRRNVLILVSTDKAPFLPDAELEFLMAILGACKLSITDVAIVNLQRYPQSYTELVKQFGSRQVLLLGVTPQQIDLPFHFPHFQLQNFDQRTYLSSFPLSAIAQDRELKTQLWTCLKTMFGI